VSDLLAARWRIAEATIPTEIVLEVTTPPAGLSPWPAARAHWGRWGGLLEASASYNVTKCDMRRSMCRSDVSVNGC